MTFLIDSKIKQATCRRCGAPVYACDVSGLRVMADPAPLGVGALREALRAGRDVFRVLWVAGDPHKLQRASAGHLSKIGEQTFVGEHTACGTAGRNALPVEAVPVAPQPSPCDAWRAQGWTPPRTCPRRRAGLLEGDDADLPVSCNHCDPPPFEYVCEDCGLPIFNNQPHWAIQYGEQLIWSMHDECRENPIWTA